MFFGADVNFWGLTQPTLASVMPVPQRYYVPARIRSVYRPRLEAGGLWSLPAIDREKENPFAHERPPPDHKDAFARVFEQQRVSFLSSSSSSSFPSSRGCRSQTRLALSWASMPGCWAKRTFFTQTGGRARSFVRSSAFHSYMKRVARRASMSTSLHTFFCLRPPHFHIPSYRLSSSNPILPS